VRLLVTGGRGYGDRKGEDQLLYIILWYLKPEVVIHGNACGADSLASLWVNVEQDLEEVEEIACPVTEEDYAKHGKAAPVLRNQRMLDDHDPDLVLAVRGGRGTEDMIRRAHKAGVPVLRLETE